MLDLPTAHANPDAAAVPPTPTQGVAQNPEQAFEWAAQGQLSLIGLFGAAQQLNERQQPERSVALYRLWLQHTQSPVAYAAHFNLAITLANLKDNVGAEQAYRSAIAIRPDFLEAHLNLGRLLEPVGRPEEDSAMWRQVPSGERVASALVSVLIPTHNRPDYLEIALKSVLAQSYDNIEIVISDNGDDTLSQGRIEPYLARHPNIKYFRKQGMTAVENFDKCFELSTGEYINYLMDDDVFHPEKIQRMMHYYTHYPKVGLVTSFRQLIDANGQPLPPLPGTEKMFPIDTVVTGQSLGSLMLRNGNNLVGEPTTVLIRRADVSGAFGTFAGRRYKVLSDVATWLQILATRDCVYISDPLSYFRMHGEQDQRGGSIKVNASMEWFGMFIDAHQQKLFIPDRTEFLGLLAAKIGGFTAHIAINHNDIRSDRYHHAAICDLIRQSYQLLLVD